MLPLIALLSATPALAAEATSPDAKALLAGAIQRGAPLYNRGSPEGCAAVYEVAAVALVRFGADELSEADRTLLEDTLSALPTESKARAWALREAFDAVLGQGPRPGVIGAPVLVDGPDVDRPSDALTLPVDGSWNEVDDRVMGGISRGSITIDGQGHAVWTGRMTTESNGGFVTARTAFDALDLSGRGGLLLRVKGDGRTYKVTLNTDAGHSRGIGMAPLRTRDDQWVEVRLPFSAFTGRMYGGTRRFDPTDVRSLQLQLSGADQTGEYRLEVAWVGAYPSAGAE